MPLIGEPWAKILGGPHDGWVARWVGPVMHSSRYTWPDFPRQWPQVLVFDEYRQDAKDPLIYHYHGTLEPPTLTPKSAKSLI